MNKLDPKMKRILSYGVVFILGIGVGTYMEKRSYQRELAQNIFSNLQQRQQSFDQDRKEFKERFKERQEEFDTRFNEIWDRRK